MRLQRNHVGNENGSTLLLAVGVTTLVLLGFLGMMKLNASTEKQMYMVRFRNQLDAFESRWQTIAGQPGTYINCTYPVVGPTPSTCTLNPVVVNNVAPTAYQTLSLVGAGCTNRPDYADAGGAPLATCGLTCGFCATATLNMTAGLVGSLTLKINPVGISIKPVEMILQVPLDILQPSQMSCPQLTSDAMPLFKGIDQNTGLAICKALAAPTACADGTYATGINSVDGHIICAPFPAPPVALESCAADQYMSGFSWDTTHAYTFSCLPRVSPFNFNW